MPTISIIQPEDFPALLTIEQLCHAYPWSAKTMQSNTGEAYLNLKIVDPLKGILGYAITQVVADEATLFNLAIHPAAQQQGLATQLLNELFSQLTERAITTLWLEVRVSNRAAIALYHQLGFNEVTIRRRYYPAADSQREDALIMAYYL